MVSVFKYFFPFIVLETSLSAIKFETRIYKPDTYLAIMERTWDIRVEIKFSIEKIPVLQSDRTRHIYPIGKHKT